MEATARRQRVRARESFCPKQKTDTSKHGRLKLSGLRARGPATLFRGTLRYAGWARLMAGYDALGLLDGRALVDLGARWAGAPLGDVTWADLSDELGLERRVAAAAAASAPDGARDDGARAAQRLRASLAELGSRHALR